MRNITISGPLSLKEAEERIILGVEPQAILRTELKLVGKLKRGLLHVDEAKDFACFWKWYCVPLGMEHPPQPDKSSTEELAFLRRYRERKEKLAIETGLKLLEASPLTDLTEMKIEKDGRVKDALFIKELRMTLWTTEDYIVSCIV